MRVLRAGAAAILVVSVAACSTTTSGSPSSKGRPTRPTSSAPSAPTTGSSSSGGPLSRDRAQAALLTASDVGGGFTERTYTKHNDPMPCAAAGSPSFRQQTSPQVDVGTSLEHASPPAGLSEQIFVYADASAAQQALSVGKEGLNCPTGTTYYDDGTTASTTISPPSDVSSELVVEAGYAWRLRTKDFKGSAVAVVIGPVVVTVTFGARAAADISKLPDALVVAKTAIDKLKSS